MESKPLIDGRWPWVFQVDSDIVRSIYRERDNYLIEYNASASSENYCAIYFSSNDLYFPNEESMFRKRIVERDAFEWYSTRIKRARKHIFVRDIFKQWYLQGINEQINSPESLLCFLQRETQGMKVITLGSSAGGYAAILYGTQLHAERILAFNAQFEINSLLASTTADRNPLLFRLQEESVSRYFDLKNVCDFSTSNLFYFHSAQSKWDNEEWNHVSECPGIHHLAFSTSHHGIPFLKVALPIVLNMENPQLAFFEKKVNNPQIFAIRMVGLWPVLTGFVKQIIDCYFRHK